SAVGADADSMIFYPKTKGELEKAITELDFEHNVILRPSLLLGEREEERLGEKIGQKLNSVLKFVAPNYQGVEDGQVAKTMIKLAKNNQKGTQIIDNKTIIELANE
ncbi:MAG TPA: oxidoreductase, partial [Chitinophagales bacterium]